jgi:hypothetical protein
MASDFQWKIKYVFAKVEVTPGLYVGDSTLFLAANCLVQGHDLSLDIKPGMVERLPDGRMQSLPSVVGAIPATFKFSHRLYTAGTAGAAITSPKYSTFLKASYVKEVIDAATAHTVTWTHDKTQQVFLSIGWEVESADGTKSYRFAISGARGSAIFKPAAGKLGDPMYVTYQFDGALAMQANGTPYPATSFETPITGITFEDEVANGIRYAQLGSPSGLFLRQSSDFSFDLGNKIEVLTDITNPSCLGYGMLMDHKPKLKLTYRTVPRSTSDDVATFVAGSTFANSVTLGSVAGKQVVFSTNAFAQFEGFTDKAIGPAAGKEATVRPNATPTTQAEDAWQIVIQG